MDTLEAIATRRSVRHFTSDPIAAEDVRTLLQAAMAAPSSANQQAWHFIAVDRRELLDQIPTFHAYCAFLHEAPLAVVVCGDLSRELSGGRFWVQDCSAATQNLLLAAHTLGLGGCWAAVYPIEERIDGLRRVLHMPEHLVPLNVVALGHPSRVPRPAERFDPERVSWNVMG